MSAEKCMVSVMGTDFFFLHMAKMLVRSLFLSDFFLSVCEEEMVVCASGAPFIS